MDKVSGKITLVSVTGDSVEFDEKFTDLSVFVANMPNKSEPLKTELSTEMLNFIKGFAEKHEYDSASISYKFPTINNSVKDNISEVSYLLIQDRIIDGQLAETAKAIAPLLAAADALQFRRLYTTLNIALLTPLHIDEDEKSIKEFMDRFDLKEDEDFKPEKITEAIDNNNALFELVVSRFVENIK